MLETRVQCHVGDQGSILCSVVVSISDVMLETRVQSSVVWWLSNPDVMLEARVQSSIV